jgi:predicted nucleotidyltransferase
MPDDVQSQLDRVVALIRDALGSDALGAYLYGSAVLGGLRPRSDLDVLVVSRRPTTRDEKRRLVDGLLAVSGRSDRPPPRPVDLTVVVESDVRPWRNSPRFDFQYGEWLRREFELGNVEPWPTTTNPDVATLVTMVLLADRPLLGPPPLELLDPVPEYDLMGALLSQLDGLLADLESDTTNALLTLARIWLTAATGVIDSKDGAAAWALARVREDRRPVLAHACAVYVGEACELWDDLRPRIRPVAETVVREIRRAAATGVRLYPLRSTGRFRRITGKSP